MGDVQRVEINEENNPSLEEQDAPEQTEQDAPEQTEEEAPERPEWLPEKFSSAEDMATAYRELESKQSKPEVDEPKSTEATPLSTEDMSKYEAEFLENGFLSEETYTHISSTYGVEKSVIDGYISGQQAVSNAFIGDLHKSVGGEENYTAMTEWASSSLSAEEIKTFDNIMAAGQQDSIKMAIDGLYARYSQSEGRAPTLLHGKASDSASNGFRSIAELRVAMSDKRYKADPAYRKDVEERLAVSNIL